MDNFVALFNALLTAFTGDHSTVAILIFTNLVTLVASFWLIRYFMKQIEKKDAALNSIVDDYHDSNIASAAAMEKICSVLISFRNGGSNHA